MRQVFVKNVPGGMRALSGMVTSSTNSAQLQKLPVVALGVWYVAPKGVSVGVGEGDGVDVARGVGVRVAVLVGVGVLVKVTVAV